MMIDSRKDNQLLRHLYNAREKMDLLYWRNGLGTPALGYMPDVKALAGMSALPPASGPGDCQFSTAAAWEMQDKDLQ
jgi:hypothetical protein